MKLFFTAGSFYPAQIGGPDNVMYWQAKALVRWGHDVSVATTDDGVGDRVPLNRWISTDYGKAYYAKTAIHYAPFRLFLASLKPLLRCDVLHLSAIFYPISWMLAPVALLLGKKVVWTPHGELDPDVLIYSTARKKMVLRLVRLFKKRILFQSTCDAETSYIRTQLGADTRIVQLPCFVELVPKQPRVAENYWLFVGRIHPKKAVERLIEALPKVPTTRKLVIVGDYDNDYGRELMALAERLKCREQVEFVGHKRDAEKYQLMANAYCLIMPSHTENFGIVVTEALTQGTPVIASKGTPWQILSDRRAGIWSANEVEPLAEALTQMATLAPEVYAQYRTNALEVVKEFDVERNIQKWETVYRAFLAGEMPLPFQV